MWHLTPEVAGKFTEHTFNLFNYGFTNSLDKHLFQEIWDEVGESDEERDKLLLQIEEECLNVYKKKVELAAKSRAELLQTLSDANVELTNLIAALGDKSYIGIVNDIPRLNLYFF